MRSSNLKQAGFTLVELLVGVFIFLIISLGIYRGFFASSQVTLLGKIKTEAALLANEQFELARNLPYGQVGLQNGIPAGALPRTQNFVRSGVTFYATTTIRNIDDPFDGTIGGTPNDTAPADYKEVGLEISCGQCLLKTPLVFTTRVSPKNLESATTNGALFIKVIDANGQPVPGARIQVENLLANPDILIDETANNQGQLQLVDVPPGNNAYHVTVTKPGYSTDGTTPITPDNPNPTVPPLTVSAQTLTNATFAIDEVGNLALETDTLACTPAAGVPITIRGKLVGTDPNVYKYEATSTTDSFGERLVSNLEWDSYDLEVTGASYQLAGSAPFLPVTLAPGASQAVSLSVVPRAPKALLVIVKDAVTGLPVSGAAITLRRNTTVVGNAITDRGAFAQSDWSGGAGQSDFTTPDQFWSENGNIDETSSPGDLRLRRVGNNYQSPGTLISSVFDAGTASSTTFYSISWNPQSQPAQAGANSLKFQIATANENTATTTWSFAGPDGTATSYYTTANGNIHASNSGRRYLRYQAFLSTTNSSRTPTLSDVAITYGSGCLPFGQALFQNLTSGTHRVAVSKTGYQNYSNTNVPITLDWQKIVVSLQPN